MKGSGFSASKSVLTVMTGSVGVGTWRGGGCDAIMEVLMAAIGALGPAERP